MIARRRNKKRQNSLGRQRPKWGEGSPHTFGRYKPVFPLWTKLAQLRKQLHPLCPQSPPPVRLPLSPTLFFKLPLGKPKPKSLTAGQ